MTKCVAGVLGNLSLIEWERKYLSLSLSDRNWIDGRRQACYNAEGVRKVQPRMKSWDQDLPLVTIP
jgi:hypothetical protein